MLRKHENEKKRYPGYMLVFVWLGGFLFTWGILRGMNAPSWEWARSSFEGAIFVFSNFFVASLVASLVTGIGGVVLVLLRRREARRIRSMRRE